DRARDAVGARPLGAPEAPGARRHQGSGARPPDGQALGRRLRAHARALRAPGVGSARRARAGRTTRMITIEQFQQVELRVGTVKEAGPHPNADRLLVLKVDLGTEERQIVAGIRAHYDPAALVGTQVVVVANLEPAKLRGVESQGMLLAASADGVLVVVRPDGPMPAGATVR